MVLLVQFSKALLAWVINIVDLICGRHFQVYMGDRNSTWKRQIWSTPILCAGTDTFQPVHKQPASSCTQMAFALGMQAPSLPEHEHALNAGLIKMDKYSSQWAFTTNCDQDNFQCVPSLQFQGSPRTNYLSQQTSFET